MAKKEFSKSIAVLLVLFVLYQKFIARKGTDTPAAA